MLKKMKSVEKHRRPAMKTEHKKEVHKEEKEAPREKFELSRYELKNEILKTPEPEFRGFRGILPQRL